MLSHSGASPSEVMHAGHASVLGGTLCLRLSIFSATMQKSRSYSSEQDLQRRTTQSSNRKGKVPTTCARIRNLSTSSRLFKTWAIVVKPSVRLAVVGFPSHRFFRLKCDAVNCQSEIRTKKRKTERTPAISPVPRSGYSRSVCE